MENKDIKILEKRIKKLEDQVTNLTNTVLLLADAHKYTYRLYEYMETISDAVSYLLNYEK